MLDEFRVDSKGRHVPVSLIKPIDLLRDELVVDLFVLAQLVSATLSLFKRKAFSEIDAFTDLSAREYGVTVGGPKGNLQLVSFCGRYKILRAVADHLVFDEQLQVAKDLIDECVREWSSNARDELRVLIQDAFQVDKRGKISTERVLRLRKLDIKDDRWATAMLAISNSIQVASSSTYIRIYERISDDQWRQVSLDLASAPAHGHEQLDESETVARRDLFLNLSRVLEGDNHG